MSLFSRAKTKPDFIDVHSHVSFKEYEHDRGAVLDRMRYAKTHSITVGVDLESSKQAVEVANGHAELYACIGLHPTSMSGGHESPPREERESFNAEDYKDLAWNIDTVAIGECGLDYYRIKLDDKKEKERQKVEFQKQIDFAVEVDLPLMLHCRPSKGTMDAYLDVLKMIKSAKKIHGKRVRGNVHFFVGNSEVAKQFVELDFTLSFTGVITFADEYDDIIRETPLRMLQAETDSPYATPVPNRGDRNEPVMVRKVVKRIAELKEEDIEKVSKQLIENAYRVFDFAN